MTNAKKGEFGKSTEIKDILIISINGIALDLRCPLIICGDLVKPSMVTACYGDISITSSILAESLCKKHWLLNIKQ